MKALPTQISVPDSRDDIVREVKRLLRAAGVEGVLPTPRQEILRCAKLVATGELDLSKYEESLKSKALGFLHRAFDKIRGFVDLRSHVVYVDPALHPSKHLFVTYHEVTHKILEWQRVIYTEDDEATLSPQCREIFEAEANFGAAEILFQCKRFEQLAKDYNLSIASALELARIFDASAHASLRRFVETNQRPCMLMVAKQTSLQHESGLKSYYICYSIASSPFLKEFGEQFSRPFLNPQHRLCRIINEGLPEEMELQDLRGNWHDCRIDVFDNRHRTFVLICPNEKEKTRMVALLQRLNY